jgi:hypothetical protein
MGMEIAMEFENIHLDYSCGQHEFVIVARDGGEPVGKLEYSLFEGTPYVKWIEAYRKRKGVGTGLLVTLQNQYRETPISFGYSTEEGTLLLESLDWRVEPNEAHVVASSRLEQIRSRLVHYQNRAERLIGATQQERDEFTSECSDWNDLSEELEHLEALVACSPPEFRFVADEQAKTGTAAIRRFPRP